MDKLSQSLPVHDLSVDIRPSRYCKTPPESCQCEKRTIHAYENGRILLQAECGKRYNTYPEAPDDFLEMMRERGNL